ncbi:MAG: tetratricopeptide repeat protein [Proteobacteria bacterium]|nr:tetratricopeptide repeat protein [Pseudomonadota bacterium]
MTAGNRSLTAAQAERLASALGLLRAGQVAQAVAITRALASEAPLSADPQHALGMSLAALGDVVGAEPAFRQAIALAPDNEPMRLDFASWLRNVGRPHHALELLAGAPPSTQIMTQCGLLFLQLGDPLRASIALEQATIADPASSIAWHGLGNALRMLDRPEDAADAFRKATSLAPESATAWINLGVALRLTGRAQEALDCLRRAEALGYTGPELQDVVNGVLVDLGRPADAVAGAVGLVARYPGFAQGHDTLAHMLLEHASGTASNEDPLARFRQAANQQPTNRDLQLRFLRKLLSTGQAHEVLARLGSGLPSGNDPHLAWCAAEAHDLLGQHQEAAALYAAAQRSLGEVPDFLNAYARHAFKAKRFDLAEANALAIVQLDPGNQEAWCHLGTSWRLRGDPRESWLLDYERLVGYVEIDTPSGFADQAGFLEALRTVLEAMHVTSRQPIQQSVRNGSQTPGQLFGNDDPVIRAAERAMRDAIDRWRSTLPEDANHPFVARKQGKLRFTGSWSVRLRSSGSHANHIHQQGWMSSAFYVSLPRAVREGRADEGHPGWLQFGQPAHELGLDLPPCRMVRPQVGWLTLFPSYMWHGTLPFSDDEPRLTIAFDVRTT